jgi:Glycosyltransferase family 87
MDPDRAVAPGPATWLRNAHVQRGGSRAIASVVFCAILPAFLLLGLFVGSVHDGVEAFDFRPFYSAAGAVLRGASPYPGPDDPLTAESGAYVYPPLTAVLTVPFRGLPVGAAGIVMMLLLAAATFMTPYVLGVRDWRCYGVLFLWPPVLSAIQTGNLTLLLGLAAALTWRMRDRPVATSSALGIALAAKFFLWPLLGWLAATRRLAAAGLAIVVAVSLLLGSWAVVGFAGLVDYPDLMRRLNASVGEDSYTVRVMALDLGLPSSAATAVWLVLGLALVAGVVICGRRGADRTAFQLGIAASLALTPIVWLHYFALLVVVVGVAAPRLTYVWFIPIAMVITPGSGHPRPSETATTVVVAAAVFVMSIRASRETVSLPSLAATEAVRPERA